MNNQNNTTAQAQSTASRLADNRKNEIKALIAQYVAYKGSKNKAANSLTTASGATIGNMLNGKWQNMSDALWLSIEREIKQHFAGTEKKSNLKQWNIVETHDYTEMHQFLADAQEDAQVMAITGEAGTGKSLAIKEYTSHSGEVFTLKCSSHWRPRLFLSNLLRAMGRDSGGYTVGEMMDDIVYQIKRKNMPLIVLDEADKLPDEVLYFFISLYNELEDQCGIVLVATDNLEKRIRRGLRLNKKGYKEIYSRLGRRFIKLNGNAAHDVAGVCMANGITDRAAIQKINEESDGDLRRVRRKVYGIKKANTKR